MTPAAAVIEACSAGRSQNSGSVCDRMQPWRERPMPTASPTQTAVEPVASGRKGHITFTARPMYRMGPVGRPIGEPYSGSSVISNS